MEDLGQKIDEFISGLRRTFPNTEAFDITDSLMSSSFALFRIKTNKVVLNDILQMKEVSKIDRPYFHKFNPFELQNIDVNECTISEPPENATGILIIDSGIVAGHPLLSQAVGDQENFQTVEDYY